MIQNLLNAIWDVPEYVHAVIYGPHIWYAVIAGVIFLIVLLITNRFTAVLRKIFVYASIAIAVFAFVTKRYALFWLSIVFLLILLIFRFIRYLIVTVREDMRNRRIERKALEKAKERRGSFRKRQGYSGEARPADPETGHAKAQDSTGGNAPEEGTSSLPTPAEISRAEMNEALQMLKKLKDLGILSEEEVSKKTSLIYEKMG